MSWLDAPEPSRLERVMTDLRRAMAWRRRLLAAGLAAAAVAFALQALAPTPAPGRSVLVVTHDLAVGTVVRGRDVALTRWPGRRLPAGALGSAGPALGRAVASGVRDGEVLTDVRLVGGSSLAGLPEGLVAVPVRVADAASVGYLRAGDQVDLLAAGGHEDGAGVGSRLAASAVRVIAVAPQPRSAFGQASGPAAGALILVAVTPDSALRLAGAAVSDRISVVLRRY